jgi:hypothetical protein
MANIELFDTSSSIIYGYSIHDFEPFLYEIYGASVSKDPMIG